MANVAIMGFGTVGSGVAEVLRMNGESIAQSPSGFNIFWMCGTYPPRSTPVWR